MSTSHGTTDCYDGGCRAPVCVHAHRVRIVHHTTQQLQTTVAAIIAQPTPPIETPPDPEVHEIPCSVCSEPSVAVVYGIGYCGEHEGMHE